MKLPLSQLSSEKLLVSPSVLACNFANLGDELAGIEAGGADMVHLDIMDGHFVPNITIGPPVIAALRPCSALPFDVHLMLSDPGRYIEPFIEAGADHITLHIESDGDMRDMIRAIHGAGCSAGITLCPKTPASALLDVLPEVDMVLVMSVQPGFGGQKFDRSQLEKISEIRRMLNDMGRRNVHIEVDGGITTDNIADAARAGANVIVAGTAIFRNPLGIPSAIRIMHDAQAVLPR